MGPPMGKKFNDTGTCIPERHFMADVSDKLTQIIALIQEGHYFTINRPRQYGKTTIQYLLWRKLKERADYFVVKISFEGIETSSYDNVTSFTKAFMHLLERFSINTHTPGTRDSALSDLLGQNTKISRC